MAQTKSIKFKDTFSNPLFKESYKVSISYMLTVRLKLARIEMHLFFFFLLDNLGCVWIGVFFEFVHFFKKKLSEVQKTKSKVGSV